MKKDYMAPEAEKIEFNYRDQVVAASGSHTCVIQWTNEPGQTGCSGTVTQNSEGV